MPDVFLSYHHLDRAGVEPIVGLLEQVGLSVWWDRHIAAGERFDSAIDRELKAARCVVVAWSATSIHSVWVLDEAGEGRDRGILLPVSLDGTEPPLSFRRYQTLDLRQWRGSADDPDIRRVVEAAARLVDKTVALPEAPAHRRAGRWSLRRVLAVAATPVALAIVAITLWLASTVDAYVVDLISVPGEATSMRLSRDGGTGYVVHSPTGTISAVDLRTRKIVRTISGIGSGALALAIMPDEHTGYVSHVNSSQVSVVDLRIGKWITDIDVGSAQWDIALSPDGRRAYTADRGSGHVSVIDTASNSVISRIKTSENEVDSPTSVAVTPDGRRAYVANRGAGTVAVVDTQKNSVVTMIAVQQAPNAIAVNPNARHAYVTNEGSGTVSVVDLGNDTETTRIPVGSAPITVAFTPEGDRALVVNRGSTTISVIDTATGGLLHTVDIGRDLGSISVNPDGRTAYVTAGNSGLLVTVTL